MAAPAFLTGLVNMLLHEVIGDAPCNYNPGQLTTFTKMAFHCGRWPVVLMERSHLLSILSRCGR